VPGVIRRQLPFFSVIVPFWLIWACAGWRAMKELWPAILVCGVSFAVPQYLVSNFHGPWLVDIIAAPCSMAALVAFLQVRKPAKAWRSTALVGRAKEEEAARLAAGLPAGAPIDADLIGIGGGAGGGMVAMAGGGTMALSAQASPVWCAWMPWIILTVLVFLLGDTADEGRS
jgi:lactate permease